MPIPRQLARPSAPVAKGPDAKAPNAKGPGANGPDAKGEDGFILLVVLFLLALLLVALAIAAPKIAISIQREREIELVHRGEQYKRAIKLYYKKFGAYPSSIDQLVKTNEIRFLRKRYTDPITGKDDWRLIYLGQAKVPPMGFFGQPLTGLAGGVGNVGVPIGATGSAAGASPFGASASGASSFGSPAAGSPTAEPPNTGASVFTAPDSDTGNLPVSAGTTTVVSNSDTNLSTPSGTGASPFGGATGAAGSSPFGSSSTGNPTLGGGPIVGVGIPSPKPSLLTYKKQTHYKDWEFVYNPLEDQMQGGLAGGSMQNVNGTSSGTSGTGIGPGIGGGSTPGGFGQGSSGSGSGFGSNSGTGFGSTPTPPTGSNPQQPQQQ